ncbi:hypothetical protein TRICI_001912 [Trichomonascus ciferrii]|uniref:Transketolase n=1 Tax=Trichomonascus ciferrii TaxID=44093 RepID=A0A642V7U4_9ASCO|nr:hypothetical protein TRICI_001912 [Trichomonascus ciferrii]
MTTDQVDLVLRSFRCLIADLVQHFNGGHPGGAIGMAAMGLSLYKHGMKYSPTNPDYFNRDRFVLSNGHTCLFQYTFNHLVGYKHMTMDQLKTYHSKEWDSYCPGHPEIEHPGIEVTTGPLGQGIANAVGMAIASKNLAATYNKPEFPVVNNTIWCMIGDACLQEGVGLEAISLAGHFKLNNLVVMYDNNQISCDGSIDLTNTENVNEKMKASGWNVIDVEDACYNVDGILQAMEKAKQSTDKPTFINCRTVIGVGSNVEGDAKAHGAAFGEDNVKAYKIALGMDPEKYFHVPDEVYDYFSDIVPRGQQLEKEWNDLVENYVAKYPQLGADFLRRVEGKLPENWKQYIPESFPDSPTPSRKSAGLVCNPLAKNINNFMVGTADLSPSVNMIWDGKVDFQHPDLKTTCGINGDYTGRYVHWGIREHAMAAISNGIAAYNKGTFIPVTSSFFMFYLYAAPAVRMGALQHLKTIHVATHDSIGTGEDGPTHQPIELAALYRAMPNLLYIRPCDSQETAGAWEVALEQDATPSIISLSRQALKQYPQNSSRENVRKGAYIFKDTPFPDITLIGVGSEMSFAVETAELLESQYGIKARIVSFPCQRLFEQQSLEYKRSVLDRRTQPIVVIEAYAATGWERYATAGISMSTFGKSLPGAEAYTYFGYNSQKISLKIKSYLDNLKNDDSLRWEFTDLNM